MISQLGMQLYDPLVAAAHSNDWLSVAGIALTGLTLASQRWADRGSFDAAARVATAAVDPVGVTFAMQGEDIVCDGLNNSYGQPPNPLLPIALLSWFSSRFLERWTEKPAVRQEFVDLLNETAIGMYYEQMAGV